MKVFTLALTLSLSIALLGASSLAGAQTAQAPTVAPAAPEMADAEVRKLDKAAGKVTLKHGPIKSLDMPSMTMVFQVKDKALLEKLNDGDKIKFVAVQEGRNYVVTQIVPQ